MFQPISQLKDNILDARIYFQRTLISLFGVLVLVAVLVVSFYSLQVTHYEDYTTQSDRNRIHRQTVPATRGLIFDRNNVLLAENIPSYSLIIIRERVTDLDNTISELAKLVDISDRQIKKFKTRSRRRHPFESVPIRYHLSEEDIAIIGVNRYRLPGVEVEARLVRSYPYGEIFSHAIGYVGRINERELKLINPKHYSGIDSIGKTGIEKVYEKSLLGKVGYQNVETNARGRVIEVLERFSPTPGKNIKLYLDTNIQTVAYHALKDVNAAAVAIEVKTGGVLAAVSTPSFDSNLFVTGISSKNYALLRDSTDLPMFNRVLQGQYPPASTIKPVIGLLGLERGIITPLSTIYDPGFYQLENDDRKYRDWKRYGHGNKINLRAAIAQSCDTYFYNLAFKLGIDSMSEFMNDFGLGIATGVDQTSERRGLMPSRQWKREKQNLPWYPGETLNTSIGQGYMLMTPLQLASMVATMASKGKRIQPRLMMSMDEAAPLPPTVLNTIDVVDEHWNTIFSAMKDVVHHPRGTAARISKGASYTMAGKTGTAQVVGIKQDERYDAEKISKRNRDHALFIGFAPYDDPEIAVAIVVENGEHGSSSAAPVARKIFDAYFARRDLEVTSLKNTTSIKNSPPLATNAAMRNP